MKLVRDNIPRLFPQHAYHVASGRELGALLKLKVMEEAGEVAGARNAEELAEELADLMEVISRLGRHYGIMPLDVEMVRVAKRKRLGAFNEGWIMADFTEGEE